MASFQHKARKTRSYHHHVLRLKATPREMAPIARGLARDLKALGRKYRSLVKRTEAAMAKTRKRQRRRPRRRRK